MGSLEFIEAARSAAQTLIASVHLVGHVNSVFKLISARLTGPHVANTLIG
jgi:hypothetical protein